MILGSTKKMTGMRCVSPGFSVCWVKQKNWILVKYLPAWLGVTLNVAVPVTGLVSRLVAVKNAMSRAPIFTVSDPASGRKRHFMPGATLLSKSMRISLLTAPGASSARCVVPLRPVTWQNRR
ncbi:hypothetical protein WR25_18471 [Diploscapter pachys]|uniref:Uncharacterized protein n=1 Tax=Diploscapter pachys TaxID=2018661 RepID=A0A2A2K055_9BILA|nr:hypothetical protein WR25_18471 [Diploscapter pachys]